MTLPTPLLAVAEIAQPTVSRPFGSPPAEETDVASVVAAARAAQASWAARPLADRLALFRRARHLLVGATAELEEAIRSSRPASLAEPAAEVLSVADACRFLERRAAGILKPRRLGVWGRPLWLAGVSHEIHREPFGVILVIAPSNYPLFLPGVQVLQALAAGNAVLVKPAEGCGRVMRQLADLLTAAGLPPALFRVLPEAPAAGQQAIEAGIDKVVLTGSARTGAAVLAQLAPRLIPAIMELSGCDAVFVRAGADLDLVSRALTFGLRWNRSETCIAPRRVFVPRALAPELEKRLAAAVGDLSDQEHRSRGAVAAVALLQDALQRGARRVAGRILPDQHGLTPTVLADASPEMPLLQEDVFAPVLSLVPVADDEEALRANTRCPYALGASVFGEEAGSWALARRVEAGGVVVNDLIVPTADPRLPFGGRGQSGFGVTRGAEGLLDLTTVKVVTVRRGRFLFHLDPPQPADVQFYRDYIRAVHAASWKGRLAGWVGVVRALWRRGRYKDQSF